MDPSLSVTAQQAGQTVVGRFKNEVTIDARIGLHVQLSHYTDLERVTRGNHSNSKATSRLQTKSSLGLNLQYNAAFIQVQTVVRKCYISGYIS